MKLGFDLELKVSITGTNGCLTLDTITFGY